MSSQEMYEGFKGDIAIQHSRSYTGEDKDMSGAKKVPPATKSGTSKAAKKGEPRQTGC